MQQICVGNWVFPFVLNRKIRVIIFFRLFRVRGLHISNEHKILVKEFYSNRQIIVIRPSDRVFNEGMASL